VVVLPYLTVIKLLDWLELLDVGIERSGVSVTGNNYAN